MCSFEVLSDMFKYITPFCFYERVEERFIVWPTKAKNKISRVGEVLIPIIAN